MNPPVVIWNELAVGSGTIRNVGTPTLRLRFPFMGTLHDAAECRTLAAQCTDIAEHMSLSAADRARLMEMAQRWRQRAQKAEGEHAKKKGGELRWKKGGELRWPSS